MNRDNYVARVQDVLSQHTERAVERLNATLLLLPEKATELDIQIFVDQGVEGLLTVKVGLNGPDLYVLNKAISAHRTLFDTVMVETGLEPDLPLMDIDEEAFSVGDVLTDCGVTWAAKVWERAEAKACRIPVFITSPDDYGTGLPRRLR